MERDLLIYACALSKIFVYKWGIATKLVSYFGSLRDIFSASEKEMLHILPGYEKNIKKIFSKSSLDEAEKEIKWAFGNGIEPIYIEDERYPKRLRECADAPILLFFRGNCNMNPSRVLAVVGTRGASVYGKEFCKTIIEYLSYCKIKPLIISGLAYGIDATAHRISIETGLNTIAVMGTGFGEIYPYKHRELSKQIMERGALVTDFVSDAAALPVNFISRNRIIAGMSDALIVCESKEKGGSLISAKMAYSYDREVFAIPGRINDTNFAGCNNLIETNIARIVTGGNSIATIMKWNDIQKENPVKTDFSQFSQLQKTILSLLKKYSSLDTEEISKLSGVPYKELSLPLIELEMNKKIIILPSNKYGIL